MRSLLGVIVVWIVSLFSFSSVTGVGSSRSSRSSSDEGINSQLQRKLLQRLECLSSLYLMASDVTSDAVGEIAGVHYDGYTRVIFAFCDSSAEDDGGAAAVQDHLPQ